MSDYVAVDVVLLLPKDITNKAIELNKRYEKRFTLDKNNCLPHITLLQAVLPKAKLQNAKSILDKLSKGFKPIKLTAELTNTPVFMFVTNKDPELVRLHQEVMSRFQSIITYNAKPEHFYGKDVSEKTVEWIRNFVANSANDKYSPHITIGMSDAPDIKDSISFRCNRLAICHLGNFNTCREILFEANLGSTIAK